MKVGVISDTHLSGRGFSFKKIANKLITRSQEGPEGLLTLIEKHFNGVNRILHAGDLIDLEILNLIEGFAPVDAVQGNMDISPVKNHLPIKKVLTIEGKKIGLIHGWGAPTGIVERIRPEFDNVDAIIFGHTHTPMNEVIEGVLFFNPGSPTDQRFAPFNSMGILEIGSEIKGTIIKL